MSYCKRCDKLIGLNGALQVRLATATVERDDARLQAAVRKKGFLAEARTAETDASQARAMLEIERRMHVQTKKALADALLLVAAAEAALEREQRRTSLFD